MFENLGFTGLGGFRMYGFKGALGFRVFGSLGLRAYWEWSVRSIPLNTPMEIHPKH